MTPLPTLWHPPISVFEMIADSTLKIWGIDFRRQLPLLVEGKVYRPDILVGCYADEPISWPAFALEFEDELEWHHNGKKDSQLQRIRDERLASIGVATIHILNIDADRDWHLVTTIARICRALQDEYQEQYDGGGWTRPPSWETFKLMVSADFTYKEIEGILPARDIWLGDFGYEHARKEIEEASSLWAATVMIFKAIGNACDFNKSSASPNSLRDAIRLGFDRIRQQSWDGART